MKRLFTTVFWACFLVACQKNDLDIKQNKALVVPQTLQDFQALLDNTSIMNINNPTLPEVGADSYYITYPVWQSNANTTRNAYVWASDIYAGDITVADWNYPYQQVFYSNVVLDGLKKVEVTSTNTTDYNNIYAQALFFRAHAFYQLAQLFCQPYNQTTAAKDLGIPLKLTADINDPITRSTVEQTYKTIINDLVESRNKIAASPLYKTRPGLPAVNGLLARAYLSMEQYDSAYKCANETLQGYNTLIDYNSLNATANNPITLLNNEVIFHITSANFGIVGPSSAIVDSLLYQSYDNNDLRKVVFFKNNGNGTFAYKGSYNGNLLLFSGIASDELYLIRAECLARSGNTTGAMGDLNTLLQKRWKTGTFSPLTAANKDDALTKILIERRKELIFRCLRWTDLRRLNKDTRFALTLYRNLNGQLYSIKPNDPKYVYPIPDAVIALSGIPQNVR